MKIEIELHEIESMKAEIYTLRKKNEELDKKLKSLNEKELKAQAVILANRMFKDVCCSVFEKLGFKISQEWLDHKIYFPELEHWLGEKWYNSPRLDITVGACITNKFRCAFLELGIKPKPKT